MHSCPVEICDESDEILTNVRKLPAGASQHVLAAAGSWGLPYLLVKHTATQTSMMEVFSTFQHDRVNNHTLHDACNRLQLSISYLHAPHSRLQYMRSSDATSSLAYTSWTS